MFSMSMRKQFLGGFNFNFNFNLESDSVSRCFKSSVVIFILEGLCCHAPPSNSTVFNAYDYRAELYLLAAARLVL